MAYPDDALPEFRPRQGTLWQRVFTPINLAAYVTWAAISFSVLDRGALAAGAGREWAGLACLLAVLAMYVAGAVRMQPDARAHDIPNVLLQGVLVVVVDALLAEGQVAVLLIIVAGQLVAMTSVRATVLFLGVLNAVVAALWFTRSGSLVTTAAWMLPVMGFQAFAGITGHYARAREVAREHLARVNAELMATRHLLEESARAGERLKLSRELHDVAGHSLTALKLNLARLQRDPALAGREELGTASALADELLGQIREVVSALRVHDGLDLRAALQALAMPLPGTVVSVEVEDGLRVDDLDHAGALLRCAQEGITNALRHGRAHRITVALRRRGDGVELTVENDGAAPSILREGNGLTGMRERLQACGGSLEVQATPPRGLRLVAHVPGAA